jgi:hypothetical protein
MPMQSSPSAANPDAYVAALTGWRRRVVEDLRAAALATAGLEETIKWGHIVYRQNGPVLLIRAEDSRVLFGFWRGQLLRETEPRLKPGGKYEMATLELRAGDRIAPGVARRLVKAAAALDTRLGDPTAVARPRPKKKR